MEQTNILIIEDDKDIRESVRILLEGEGFCVTEAYNGIEGIKQVTKSTHLIILDIMMPGMSGLKTCEEIRKFSYVPILFLTETEYEILLLMMKYPNKIFSVQNLYESVWDEPFYNNSANTVMVHIRKLRKKVEKDPQMPKIIQTVWGKGYRFGDDSVQKSDQ